MQLEAENNPCNHVISLSSCSVTISDKEYKFPIRVDKQLVQSIPFSDIESINYQELAEENHEIVIIATGIKQCWPSKETDKKLVNLKTSFEFMNNEAAVSTFNLLLADNRNIVLLLLY